MVYVIGAIATNAHKIVHLTTYHSMTRHLANISLSLYIYIYIICIISLSMYVYIYIK